MSRANGWLICYDLVLLPAFALCSSLYGYEFCHGLDVE
jgi:hypothetical protein